MGYHYFQFLKTGVRRIGILLPLSILSGLSSYFVQIDQRTAEL